MISFSYFLHNIVFSPHALHILILHHTYAFTRSRFHGAGAGDLKGSYGGPQAPSVVDANIVVIKASSGAFNHAHCLLT
jgi:hypothetical protein